MVAQAGLPALRAVAWLLALTVVAARAETGGEAAIRAIVQRHLKHGGVAVAVVKGGAALVDRGFGYADIEKKLPVTSDTVFDLASVGKQFTGLAVLILVDRGTVRLTDDVRRYVPEVPVFDPRRPVTIADLAHHISGLPDVSRMPDREKEHRSVASILGWLKIQKALDFPTGSDFAYNNLNYVLLALVVERAAREPFSDFLKREVFRRAGMATAQVLERPDGVIANRAVGYCLGAKPCRWDDAIPGSANVFASMRDMIAWDRSWRANRWVKDDTLRKPFLPGRFDDGRAVDYGFGWSLSDHTGRRLVWHDGDWLGASAYIARYVDDDLTVILLSNAARVDVDAMQGEIAKLYLK